MSWSVDQPEALLAEIWRKLGRATVDRRSSWRTPVVATQSEWGPEARTVVLREVDPVGRGLCFHTDARSQKVGELTTAPLLTWVFWDSRDQVQLRARARAALYRGDEVARAHWNAQNAHSRELFARRGRPGAEIGDRTAPDSPFDAFVWVETAVDHFDWLWLGPSEHVRFHFDLATGAGQRVVP